MKYTINDAITDLRKLCFPDEFLTKAKIRECKRFYEKHNEDEAVCNSGLDEPMAEIFFIVISYIGREDFLGRNDDGTPLFEHEEMDEIIDDDFTDTSWGEGFTESEDGTSLY